MDELIPNLLPMLQMVFAVLIGLIMKEGVSWLKRVVRKTPAKWDDATVDFILGGLTEASKRNGSEFNIKRRR